MARNVGIAGAAFLLLYVIACLATGQPDLLRMRLVFTLLVPFLVVIVVREWLSRQELIRARQDLA